MEYNCSRSTYLNNNKDPWRINALLMKSSSDIQSVLNYSPWNTSGSPFILTIEFSKNALYLLLRNGIVIKIGTNNVNPSPNQMYLIQTYPKQIIFPTKIIDLTCGLEHALAKTKDMKVYSWGNNTYGQLGFNTRDISYKDDMEPCIISQLTQWKITQIYAVDYNSYCLTSDNVLFGFGNNEQGQLLHSGESKISSPLKIAIFNSSDENGRVMLNKKANKLFYLQMNLPIKSLGKSIEINQNFKNNNEEFKLIAEIKELKEKLDRLMQTKNTNKDNGHLISKIEQLIIKYEEKSNKNKMEYKTIRDELDPGKSYDKLIDLFKTKTGKLLQEIIVKDLTSLDDRFIHYPFNQKIKKEAYHNFCLKQSNCLSLLLQGSSSNIQIQRTKYIEKLNKENKKHLKHLQKNKDYLNYIQLFKEVIEEITNKNKQSNNPDSLLETNNIKEKCAIEFHNFRMNTLEGITTSIINHHQMNNSSMSLNDCNNKSSVNLGKLSEKMSNLALSALSTNDLIGRKILNIFDKNIVLVHQNNYLTHFILNKIVSNVYNHSVEKGMKYHNPHNYNALRNSVEEFKLLYEEREEQKIRNQIKAKIINSNYRTSPEEEYLHNSYNSELNSEDELN